MAKKQQETGPGTGMIIALVFFVLTTVILGVTTYLGFDGQTALEEKSKKATEEKTKLEARVAEETARRNMHRVLNGVADDTDRTDLNGAARANKDAILDEYKKIVDRLGSSAFPPGSALQWQLINDLQGGGPSGPASDPNKTLPQIAKAWEALYRDAETRFRTEKSAHQQTLAQKVAADKRAEEQKATFDKQVEELTARITKKIADMDTAFASLKTEADKKGVEFERLATEWANAKSELENVIVNKNAEIRVRDERIHRILTQDPSDILHRLNRADTVTIAERMGTVRTKDGTFVNIEFGGRRVALVAGQTFVVIAPNNSLVEVLQREKELEERHHKVVSLDAREPFTDNERVKGMVEITDVTSANSARARVTYEAQPIRNPVARGDQLFNMALSSLERETVAFAGIIDLDGDGRPDTEAFINVLNKNNLRVAAHLDLKTGEIKGRLDFGTRLLILGTDVPLVGNVKKMVDEAKAKNIPMVDVRRFLNLVGVRPPRNPAPPEYTRVTLGREGILNKDPEAPPAPPADPKKDEGPKKDEKKDQ